VRAPTFTDDEIAAGLRAAAAVAGQPLAVTAYDAWRRSAGDDGATASSTLVIRRFGSWVAACEHAGVRTNKTRSTSRRWSDEEVVAIVAAYLAADAEAGGSGSYAGYVAWARDPGRHGTVPSGPTLRQRYPTWNELKDRAREHG
jgi:hypothetical protein